MEHETPPTHRADAPGVWVHPSDPHLDRELYEREVQAMEAEGRRERERLGSELDHAERLGDSAAAAQIRINMAKISDLYAQRAHPLFRYFAGKTRFDVDAAEKMPGGETRRASDYFGPGVRKFTLRRLDRNKWREVQGLAFSDVAGQVVRSGVKCDPWDASGLVQADTARQDEGYEKAARYGVVSVDGLGLDRDKDGLTDAALDKLHELDPGLIRKLGQASILYSQPLRENEFLPSA